MTPEDELLSTFATPLEAYEKTQAKFRHVMGLEFWTPRKSLLEGLSFPWATSRGKLETFWAHPGGEVGVRLKVRR